MSALKVNGSFTQFIPVLRSKSCFETHGALRGFEGGAYMLGQLDRKYHDSASSAEYVVYSYYTPIAWFVRSVSIPSDQSDCSLYEDIDGWWVVPDAKYSVTTSKHQGRIRPALSCILDFTY
jgi:hypothetical protein